MRSSGSRLLGLFAIITILLPLAAGATTTPLLPDAGQGGFAGTSVAIFGDLAAVGAPDAGPNGAGEVYLYEKSGDNWRPLPSINQPLHQDFPFQGYPDDVPGPGESGYEDIDGNGGDDFGQSVFISGFGSTYYLIVGAPGDDEEEPTAGAGYIFTISSGIVSSSQKLSFPETLELSNRAIGTSVGIYWNASSPNQSLAVLGAPLDSVSSQGTNSGSVAIFGYNGASWSLVNSRVFPSDGDSFDRFGESVAVNENFVIVGAASARSDSGLNGGEVYIYSQGNWTSGTKLSGLLPAAISLSTSDLFGESVSIDGDFAIVGASGYDDDGLSNSGGAFVFSRNPSTGVWSFADSLIPADNGSLDRFGRAVSLSGNYAVIGAPEEGIIGAAYVYENSNGSWIPFLWDHDQNAATEEIPKKLPTSAAIELTENAKYGASVSVYDDPSGVPSVIVGAPENGPLNGFLSENEGSAQIDGDVSSNQPQNIAPVLATFTDVFSTELVDFSQPFQAYDFDLDSLTVTASSSDAFVASSQNIFLDGGSLGNGLTIPVDSNGSLQGTLSVTPSSRGEATITIEVSDGEATAVGSFQITISFPPAILDENGVNIEDETVSFSSPEDQLGNIPFQIADGDGDTLTVSAISSNDAIIPSASLEINNQGSTTDISTVAGANSNVDLAFQPVLDAVGTATLTVTVTDGSATVETAFAVTITDVNDPPFFTNLGTVSVEEDSGLSTATFSVEDVDSPSGNISVDVISVINPDLFSNNLTPTGSGNTWSLDFTPRVDASGTAEVTLEASDGSASDTGVLIINVTEDGVILEGLPPSPPLEVEEDNSGETTFTLRHTSSLLTTVTVSSNNGILLPNTDTNIKLNGATRELTVSSFSGNEATLNLLLDPEPNQSGVADITVTATDVNGNTDTGSFTFTVTDVNDPPVLSGISDALQTINEDTTYGPIPFTIDDPDDLLADLEITAVSSIQELVPDNRIEITGTGNNRSLRISPLPNQNSDIHGGPTRITITVSDGDLEDSTSFDLRVDAVNDDPVFTPSTLPSIELKEDDPPVTLSYSVQDVDLEPLVLTVAASNEALFESVHFGSDPNTGPNQTFLPASSDPIPFDITLNLAEDQFGSDFIEVTATDGGGDTVKSFFVSVASDNDPPEITGEAPAQGSPGQLYSFTVAVSDVETPEEDLVVSVIGKPTWAQFDRSTFTFSGTPTNDDIDNYSVTIVVTDADNESASKVFNFSIVREEFAPEINNLGQTAYNVSENGILSIPFEVSDANADTLLVTAALQNINSALLTDTGVGISGLAMDGTIQVDFDSPSALSLEVSPEQYANSVKYGTANIVVTVDDQMGSPVATETFTITVDPVATAPIILLDNPDPELDEPLNNQTFETDESAILEVPFSFTERDWGTLTISANSGSPAVIPNNNIDIRRRGQSVGLGSTYSFSVGSDDPQLLTIALEPAEFASGTAIIELTFNLIGLDDSIRTNTVRFVVSVNPVNDAPEVTANTAPWSMQEGTTAGFEFNVSDPEGDDLLLTISTVDFYPDGEILPANESHIRINGVGYQSGGFPLTETVYNNPIQIELTPTPFTNTFGINPVEITFLVTETTTDPALASQPLVVKLEVTPVNDPPTLEPISSQTIVEDAEKSTVTPIPLVVSDPDGDELEFTFTSENTDLILEEEIHLYVNGNRRFPAVLTSADYDIAEPQVALRIVPIANANSDLNGTAFINVTVTDPSEQSVTQRFRLTVTPVPDMPVVDYNDGPWVIAEEGRIDTSFTVSDPDGDSLLVTVASDQPDVVPNNKNNLILSGAAGTNLTGDAWVQANVPTTSGQVSTVNLAILPLEDQFTLTPLTITLTASDGTLDAVPATFNVTVENVNDLPVVTGFFDPSTMVFGETKVIPFSVSDADPGDLALITGTSGTDGISALSSNTDLVDNSNLVISKVDGEEGKFTLSITANANAEIGDPFSSSQITVLVNDQKQATQIQFTLQVFPDTTLIPEISYSFDPLQFMEEDTTKVLTFEILYEGSAEDFELFGVSGNEDLVPSGNITFSPGNPTEADVFPYEVSIKPAKNAFSSPIDSNTANITILVDANGFFARADFEVSVLPINDPPMITLLFDPNPDTDAQTFANAPKTLEFRVSDVETAANDLEVSVEYSPLTGVITDAALECIDGNCQVTFTPVRTASEVLTAVITLTVDDGSGDEVGTVSEPPFDFEVLPNNSPAISIPQTAYQTSEGTTIVVEFTVSDPNGGDLDLVFSADPDLPIRSVSVSDAGGNRILDEWGTPGTVFFPEGQTIATLFLTIEPEPGVFADTRIEGTVQDSSLAQGQDIFDLRIFTPGDIDADGDADLADVISGLQILVGLQPASVDLRADVNGDDRLGLPEVIYDLQVVAEIR
jgi:hypothetical protein